MSEQAQQRPDGSRLCLQCGGPFWPLAPAGKYCGAVCRIKAERQRRAGKRPDRPTVGD